MSDYYACGEPLDFLVKYYRGEVFLEWLDKVYRNGSAHGHDLVIALGSPRGIRPGLTDNVNAADQFLKAAIREGFVLQGECAPFAEQIFFDVERNLKSKGPRYPRYYQFYPVPELLNILRGQ